MKILILIIRIQGFLRDHSIVDNKLGRPKKSTSRLISKIEHVVICEKNSNTKKDVQTSNNFFLLLSTMHLITP